MLEVVTAVACDEWEGIVMVTIVLVGACVCDTDPDKGRKRKLVNNGSLHMLQVLGHEGKAPGTREENFSSLLFFSETK